MAHKTLIGGTAYEISGGKTLVDGTGYKIKSGKTMIDGTVYEVRFGPPMLTITIIVQNGYSCTPRHPEVTIPYNGGTFEVSPESVLTFNFKNEGDTDSHIYERVYVNGTSVYSRGLYYGDTGNYSYTVTQNATITINCPKRDDGTVTITEIRNDPATITITGDDPDGYAYASVMINGDSYSSRNYNGKSVSVEVVAGSIIECSAYTPSGGTSSRTYISVNGTQVTTTASSGISYSYTVTGNASIRLRSREKYSTVSITEQ